MAKELKHLAQSREQIGGRFKQLRASLGLSTARMAEAVGLRERKSWEGYEAGHHLPNGSVLLVIAGVQGLRHARKPACGVCVLAKDCPSYGTGPTDPLIAAALVKGPETEHLLALAGL